MGLRQKITQTDNGMTSVKKVQSFIDRCCIEIYQSIISVRRPETKFERSICSTYNYENDKYFTVTELRT